jgi:hypothetical protein
MQWSYTCPSDDSADYFDVGINRLFANLGSDPGPNEEGAGRSGTNFYSDTGALNLSVVSDCSWNIQILPSTGDGGTFAHGYWLVGSDGGIFSFGAVQFHGSMGSTKLQRPVVAITPTADHDGYWLVASDGGIFALNAGFYGSIPGLGLAPAGSSNPRRLNAPIVGMVPSPDGGGYFMVASDGGVFAFGDAKYAGSCPALPGGCSGAAVAVMSDATGTGYWVVTTTGRVCLWRCQRIRRTHVYSGANYLGRPHPVRQWILAS